VAAVCQNGRRAHNPPVRRGRACRCPLLVLAALVASSACRRTPTDPVAAVLADLEAAAEARDAGAVADRLSADLRIAAGGGRTDAVADLKRYFAAYESVAIEVYGVESERSSGSASVRCVVEFSGRARQLLGLQGLLPPSAVYRFDLELAEEAGTWRVRRAAWAPAEKPAE
jgi:hypothetical protein